MSARPLIAAALLVTAVPIGSAKPSSTDWRQIITSRDHDRLKAWRTAWMEGLAQARAGGAGAAIDREGALLQPDAALDHADAPDGAYRCRMVKLGAQQGVPSAYRVSQPFRCRIAGGTLTQLDGPQRPSGCLFAYDGARILFLGGLALGDEVGDVRYGRDPQRDLVGLLERIGPRRWRVAFPRPAWEAKEDVLELVPDAD